MRIFEISKPSQVELIGLAKEIRGTQSHTDIVNLITKHFPMTTAKVHTTSKIDSGEMNISAHYDPDIDEEGGLPIHIDLMFSNKDDENVEWTKQGRKFFLYKLQDTMKHELLHMTQHRERSFHPGRDGYVNDKGIEYEYMSRPDEIEAYAMNIADELTRHVGKDGAVELLRMAKKTAQFKTELGHFLSPDLMAYFALFKWDASNPVIKKLLKKVYIYLQQSK
jgi:predicted dehydrogenase